MSTIEPARAEHNRFRVCHLRPLGQIVTTFDVVAKKYKTLNICPDRTTRVMRPEQISETQMSLRPSSHYNLAI